GSRHGAWPGHPPSAGRTDRHPLPRQAGPAADTPQPEPPTVGAAHRRGHTAKPPPTRPNRTPTPDTPVTGQQRSASRGPRLPASDVPSSSPGPCPTPGSGHGTRPLPAAKRSTPPIHDRPARTRRRNPSPPQPPPTPPDQTCTPGTTAPPIHTHPSRPFRSAKGQSRRGVVLGLPATGRRARAPAFDEDGRPPAKPRCTGGDTPFGASCRRRVAARDPLQAAGGRSSYWYWGRASLIGRRQSAWGLSLVGWCGDAGL